VSAQGQAQPVARASALAGAHPAPADPLDQHGEGFERVHDPRFISALCDRVYRLLREELRLERERCGPKG